MMFQVNLQFCVGPHAGCGPRAAGWTPLLKALLASGRLHELTPQHPVQLWFSLTWPHLFVFSFVALAQGHIQKKFLKNDVREFVAYVFLQEFCGFRFYV